MFCLIEATSNRLAPGTAPPAARLRQAPAVPDRQGFAHVDTVRGHGLMTNARESLRVRPFTRVISMERV